jgi:hypothetical protein
LAGESSGDEIDPFELAGVDSLDVSVSSDLGPMFFKDSEAVCVVLNLPAAFPPGSFKAEIDAADSREE